ncbi:MAG: HlyD family efflux transporter periplasmic adaptor subunit [Mailhella sp.]|nr:HlyD family efflux transporter periplasmic adaptor subunit [Mailhella sp.]
MKKLLFALFLLSAAAAAAWGWKQWQQQSPVRDGQGLRLYGNIDIRQVSLAFEISGRITEILAEEGDPVSSGQLLARIDTTALSLQEKKVEADIQAQEHMLRRMRNGSRVEETARAEAALHAAAAAQEQAAKNEQRVRKLRAQNSISQQDLENAQTALRVASAQADEARQTLALLHAGTREEDLAAAGSQLDSLRASLAMIRHSISQGELRAPLEAVVTSRLLEPGDMASPATPVFRLSLTSPKWARAYVSETNLGRVRTGMRARISCDSFREPVDGRIGFISPTAEFTPKSVQTEELRTSLLYEVRIITDDPQDRLRLGMPVSIDIQE